MSDLNLIETLTVNRARLQIATAALQGILANPNMQYWEPTDNAINAVAQADALIKELSEAENENK